MVTLTSYSFTRKTELRPKVKDHYRADKMALWLKLIPELLANVNSGKVSGQDADDDDDEEDDEDDEEAEGE